MNQSQLFNKSFQYIIGKHWVESRGDKKDSKPPKQGKCTPNRSKAEGLCCKQM